MNTKMHEFSFGEEGELVMKGPKMSRQTVCHRAGAVIGVSGGRDGGLTILFRMQVSQVFT